MISARCGVVLLVWSIPLLASNSATHATAPTSHPNGDTLAFAVAYQGDTTTLAINLATILPGDSLEFAVIGGSDPVGYEMRATAGVVHPAGANRWWWLGPTTTGHVRLVIESMSASESMMFNAFVLVPRTELRNGYLNGYRIGEYPRSPLRDLDIYRPPAGFIEVTTSNQHTHVSPHFRLGEFLAKQGGGFPKYLVLDERLVRKLEFLLRRVRDAGYSAKTFFIMSGYRTPYYNRTLRNVRYSRHVYGAAADIFIDDDPADGVMDDLNHDGRIDTQDAQVLIDLVNDQLDDPAYAGFVGGLGRYAPNTRRGPFVHVDIRERVARW